MHRYTPSPTRTGHRSPMSESVRSQSMSPSRRLSSVSRSPTPRRPRRSSPERSVVSVRVPAKLSQPQLREIFEYFGDVKKISFDDHADSTMRAYVGMVSGHDAKEAVWHLDGGVIDGVKLVCDLVLTVPRASRPKADSYKPRSPRRRSPVFRRYPSRSPIASKRRRRVYSRSPRPRSRSPRVRAHSPRQRSRSPLLRSRSPRPRYWSPRLRAGSPRLRSPRPRLRSPRSRSRSPRPRSRSRSLSRSRRYR